METTITDTNKITPETNDKDMLRWEVELTDTFGGERNYSYVVREQLTLPSNLSPRALAREFKYVGGYTNQKGRSAWVGEEWEFRPYNECMILSARPLY